ncbi:MAG: NAD-dependent epimerase/dehydratase family protein [bacterium]|nr:NAD-dependent epimerase/dehydratase family protein [bacterium]
MKRAVVTGGGGFVGGAIVRELLASGTEVVSIARGAYPELEALGARTVRGDLAQPGTWTDAFAGCDVVFHVAAKAGFWGPREAYWSANVDGTRHVLDAARSHGVERLVFTSSPSVCFDGTDHIDAGPDLPYPESYLAAYPESKAHAETLVLRANGAELATCSLRPHLVFGPGDPHIVPRLIERARGGKLRVVGDGRNEVSITYVGNAAHAHVQAAHALAPGAAHAGRAYFIANEGPVLLWDWIGALLGRLGIEPPGHRVSHAAARRIGRACEALWRTLPLPGEPPMTRFVAGQLATSHSYDLSPARRDFGYEELVGMDEATERTVAWFANGGS